MPAHLQLARADIPDHLLGYFRPRMEFKQKDQVPTPWMFVMAMIADGWYFRGDVVWSKANPMPESVTDRPTRSHEYLFLFSKQPRYYWDADAIREDGKDWSRGGPGTGIAETHHYGAGNGGNSGLSRLAQGYKDGAIAAGRNRRSVWTIPTEPFPEAHFATYPQELVRPCIQAGTSEHGECAECGAPWRRVTDATHIDLRVPGASRDAPHRGDQDGRYGNRPALNVETTGWQPSCGCLGMPRMDESGKVHPAPPSTQPQLVLDPFIGSGTTALVARKHGRRCIGIDLSSEYLAIAAKRTQQLSLLGGAA